MSRLIRQDDDLEYCAETGQIFDPHQNLPAGTNVMPGSREDEFLGAKVDADLAWHRLKAVSWVPAEIRRPDDQLRIDEAGAEFLKRKRILDDRWAKLMGRKLCG